MTTTQAAIMAGLQTAMLNIAELQMRPKRDHQPMYDGAALRAIRAKNGVGRRRAALHVGEWRGVTFVTTLPAPLHGAVAKHGSQRAAAKALGLNLSTFQRRLAKEAA